MRLCDLSLRILFCSAAIWACAAPGFGQDQPPANQNPDIVRVNTSLVQTDVMVFDKQGRFVDNLKREQFVLKIDGKPKDISFFERIEAGSRNEEAQLAAARGASADSVRPGSGAIPLDRGRTIFFFVDDLHLSAGSLKQVRVLLSRFIESDMGQNDEAAITSSSGQIGFLQQLTDNKRVLQAASERLFTKAYTATDSESPPMSPYQAILIESSNNDVFTFFVDEMMKRNPGLPRNAAEEMVHARASQIIHATNFITTNTLAGLKTLISTAKTLPGRKLLFLLSDGFLLDDRNSDSYQRLGQITAAAAATGVIIYSIDARGLTTGLQDASSEGTFDPSGRLNRSAGSELGASREGLNALAVDTGGRAFFNTNALSGLVKIALKETSSYYLMAWRPENEDQRNQKGRRVEVSVRDRPELVTRFRSGIGETQPSESAERKRKPGQPGNKQPGEMMADALRAAYPKSDLPVSISLNFLDVAQYGSTLTTSVKVSTDSLVFATQPGGQPTASVDVAGAVFDDHGKPVSTFNKRFTITPKSGDPKARPPENLFYNHFYAAKPGLYQVRVAAVDAKQNRVGSAVRWIEIPDLGSRTLALSSLIVGETNAESGGLTTRTNTSESGETPAAFHQVNLNIDHKFARSSRLRFLTFVYNALTNPGSPSPTSRTPGNSTPASSISGPGSGPDLAVQVQVFRDNEPVITTLLHKIQLEGVSDLSRLPYAAEITLDGLQPGRYVLVVTVIDRVAKASASQKFDFQVD